MLPGDNSSNSKRIAKNTAYLYIRMLFTAFLSLYTARVVLKNLGVEDFGIYNVVGGVVTFMGFVNATLSSATQRFLTYNLGLNDHLKFRQTFSLLINIYLIFCGIAIVVLEVVGPLYISNYMMLPPERVTAAHWVFQFSLLSFLINSVTVPHRSSIIAYEKMGVYAYIGIAEAVLAFAIVILLPYVKIDRLVLYSLLMSIIQVGIAAFIISYCRYRLSDCRYIHYWNGNYFKELLSYSGWNLFGSISHVLILQGQAIVLNYFFGPIINAAKAVSDRVNSMITQFSNNFYIATTPQIIKSYASGNIEYMKSLVLNSSRYSFMMLFILSVPLWEVMDAFLELWLGAEQVTYEMIQFCKWVVVFALVNILEQPITMAVRATGNIKKYQISVGLITLSFLPLCILLFLIGVPAYFSMILLTLVCLIAMVVRVYMVSNIIETKPLDYLLSVVVPIIEVLLIIVFAIWFCNSIGVLNGAHWIWRFAESFFFAVIDALFIGVKKSERRAILRFVYNKILKR